ncbi:MAG TPA: GNAT family N-acetyltransferase [Candidatus Scybalocola faecigallinarum]|uniref:GNAT family N-acetyltransferase n=1 Tax=Candidatus Scybalocola faecigallinarum TaxID=2840941 RepID=A0A9D1F234_9FIRM|nr:GNAT family N-acetyltransferase [Candidatus Scybalocola faecigallinarum]
MPIPGIQQPEVLHVPCQDHIKLRLRKYDGHFNFAWPWYQDPETVRLVDGKIEPYSMERIEKMYTYLNAHGELYFIEIFRNDLWTPVGDVTFWQEDMPIVIGDPLLRGMGLGTKVVCSLVRRGIRLGYKELFVDEIYDYNTGSRKCFEKAGFRPYEKTEKGWRYVLHM